MAGHAVGVTRVLVTGAGGFLGIHVLDHILSTTDWHVVALDSFRHKGLTDRLRYSERVQAASDRVTVLTHDLNAPLSSVLAHDIGPIDYILHLAADSHVDRSLDNPVRTVTNNINSTLHMLEYARVARPQAFVQVSTDEVYGPVRSAELHAEWSSILPSNPYSASKAAQEALCIAYWRSFNVPLIITNCWDMETQVFTPAGLKSYDQISVGDLVWTLDESEKLVQQPVLDKVRMPGPSNMIQFSTGKVKQLVTPNHRMMFRKSRGKPRRWGHIEEAHAETLLNTKRIRVPTTGLWEGKSNVCDARLASVFGWFVSEGFFADGNTVCFGAGTPWQVNELIALLKPYGNAYKNGTSVRIANKALKQMLIECGRGAENKHIPQWLLDCDTATLRLFWDAAMLGDGNQGKYHDVYYTKSWRLAEQMCEVGMKIGYAVRISKRKTWNPAKTILAESFIVRFRLSEADIEAKNVKRVPYVGDVWCVKVPSGRVFTARENVISLTGQTMNMFGEYQDPEKFVPKAVRQALAGNPITVHAIGREVGSRCWLHARNNADAMLWLLRHHAPARFPHAIKPDRYNIVGERHTNAEIAEAIFTALGKPSNIEFVDYHTKRTGHDLHYGLDGNKLAALGWHPPVAFRESLTRAVQWYERNLQWLTL